MGSDQIAAMTESLAAKLNASDRSRIDLLLTSIREAELRLQRDRDWVQKPKPTVPTKPYVDDYSDDLQIGRAHV